MLRFHRPARAVERLTSVIEPWFLSLAAGGTLQQFERTVYRCDAEMANHRQIKIPVAALNRNQISRVLILNPIAMSG
jgi:hypothetical protein